MQSRLKMTTARAAKLLRVAIVDAPPAPRLETMIDEPAQPPLEAIEPDPPIEPMPPAPPVPTPPDEPPSPVPPAIARAERAAAHRDAALARHRKRKRLPPALSPSPTVTPRPDLH
jgi:hypothetical protein